MKFKESKKEIQKFLPYVILGLVVLVLYFAPKPIDYSKKTPFAKYVAIVVEENHSFEEVVGNKQMPYINQLATNYGLATNFYANERGSIKDYFILTAGRKLVSTNETDKIFDVDNIFGRVMEAGLTWKTYAQSIPAAGDLTYGSPPYIKRHVPATYFADTTTEWQRKNIVPTQQLAADLAANNLANFMMIIPDGENDAHDGSLSQADKWLAQNIAPLLANREFYDNGLLIITFDEGNANDDRHGGGRVVTILAGSKVKPGFSSDKFYRLENILRTTCDAFGFVSCPGQADDAESMLDFFK